MSDWITLDDGDALAPRFVGSKAAALARLRMAGFEVPDGWILPVGSATERWAGFADAVTRVLHGPVAVRSSASWEDLATAAAAGQSVTVLDVEGGAAVLEAIRECHRAAEERDVGGDAGLAILVQPMLAPDHAGVAFGLDPSTGDRDVVRINAVEGIGAPLVGGEAVGWDMQVRGDRVEGDTGTLGPGGARAVAAVVRRVELLLGGPQDLEWAMVEGTVHVLQARPVTVVPVRPTMPPGDGWEKDVAHYSDRLTPFGFEALGRASEAVPEVFAAAGFLIDGLEEVLVGGESYGRVVPAIGAPGGGAPPPAAVLGVLARLVPALRRRTAAARTLLAPGVADRWIQRWVDQRDGWVERMHDRRADDLAAMDDEALIAWGEACLDVVVEGGRLHFEVMVPYVLALHHLHGVLDQLPGWDAGDTAALLAGASPATSASEDDMRVLRNRIAATPGAAEALRGSPGRPIEALEGVDSALADVLRRWLLDHGWRALDYDAGMPVLAERPVLVTRLLLAEPTRPDEEAPVRAARDARDRLPAADRVAFDRALATARQRYPWREDTVVLAGDMPLGLLRAWLLEVGGRLVDRGLLPTVGDGAYLLWAELVDALRGRLPRTEAVGLVVRRRGEEAWTRANPGPLVVGTQGPPPDVSALPSALRRVNEAVLWLVGLEYPGDVDEVDLAEDVLLTGVGGSPGTAEGTVRIVTDHTRLGRLEEGDVLVCQTTNPAWVPLFPLVRAIVADGGGALSHVSIAAREHGLPAVVGTRVATSVLVDGQWVRVDGTTGRVSVVVPARTG